MTSTTKKRLRNLFNILKVVLPVNGQVTLKYEKLKDCCGYVSCTGKLKKRYVIHIDESLSRQPAIDTLLHEWAHARTGSKHDAHWGIEYAKAWRMYVGE